MTEQTFFNHIDTIVNEFKGKQISDCELKDKLLDICLEVAGENLLPGPVESAELTLLKQLFVASNKADEQSEFFMATQLLQILIIKSNQRLNLSLPRLLNALTSIGAKASVFRAPYTTYPATGFWLKSK